MKIALCVVLVLLVLYWINKLLRSQYIAPLIENMTINRSSEWKALSKVSWPKWITKKFPRGESPNCNFKGKTFLYRVETAAYGGIQGQHNGTEKIVAMYRRVK